MTTITAPKGTTLMTVAATEVETGDFLPGFGNGYVVEVEPDTECSAFTGRYNAALGTFTVLTFHDQDGEENYALLTPESRVTVAREDA